MSDDRALAEAIHHEIISRTSVETALRLWDDLAVVHPNWDRCQRMRFALAGAASDAIDRVLVRRLAKAARTGPWDAQPGDVERLPKIRELAASQKEWHALPVVLRLLDAALCARTGPWKPPP